MTVIINDTIILFFVCLSIMCFQIWWNKNIKKPKKNSFKYIAYINGVFIDFVRISYDFFKF